MTLSLWPNSFPARERQLQNMRTRQKEIAERNISAYRKVQRELEPIKKARREKVKDWKIGDRVSNGKRTGTISSINYDTGYLVIQFRLEEQAWMPDGIEKVGT